MALSLHSWHSVRLMAHGQWGPARPRCPGAAAVGPDPDLGALIFTENHLLNFRDFQESPNPHQNTDSHRCIRIES